MAAVAQNTGAERLAALVEGLTLDSVTQDYPGAHPDINPFDIYRAHLSNVLAQVSGVDRTIIYPVVMRTQSLDKGDFIVAVPAFRIKGAKPDALASEWAGKVCMILARGCCIFWLTNYHNSFPKTTPCSKNLFSADTSCPFSSKASRSRSL